MRKAFRLSAPAKLDADELVLRIAEDDWQTALRIDDELESTFELLASRPHIGHTRTHRPRHSATSARVAVLLLVDHLRSGDEAARDRPRLARRAAQTQALSPYGKSPGQQWGSWRTDRR
jgi:plasmid stabilization system protein ParE